MLMPIMLLSLSKKKREDIDTLVENINVFGVLTSAKINWGKSEAVTISDELSRKLVLPAGLIWNKGGFKYLGVYLGDYTFVWKMEMDLATNH